MASPVQIWKGIERQDRYTLLSGIVIPFAFWWFYIGRVKYGTKGLK